MTYFNWSTDDLKDISQVPELARNVTTDVRSWGHRFDTQKRSELLERLKSTNRIDQRNALKTIENTPEPTLFKRIQNVLDSNHFLLIGQTVDLCIERSEEWKALFNTLEYDVMYDALIGSYEEAEQALKTIHFRYQKSQQLQSSNV